MPPQLERSESIRPEELRLATRNHGLPLEALAYDLTPDGLHYLLVHYDIPVVDASAWRLTVGGLVGSELSLSLDELRARPKVSLPVTMECAGNGRAGLSPRPISQPWLLEAVGTAEWTGLRLRELLDAAKLSGGAEAILFTGLDQGYEGGEQQRYERALTLEQALDENVLLAYEMNGRALLPQHGFPLRLVVPGWYGMTNVKWLARITVLDRPFEGYQQTRAYRFRDTPEHPGEPVSRMAPRSLMIPPGVPNFHDRERLLELAPTTIRGRAWSGHGRIERVELSSDGGVSWGDARLEAEVGPHAWSAWSFDWNPQAPGSYELCCRATDAAGNSQPLDPRWNLGGYANNEVQRVHVTVGSA